MTHPDARLSLSLHSSRRHLPPWAWGSGVTAHVNLDSLFRAHEASFAVRTLQPHELFVPAGSASDMHQMHDVFFGRRPKNSANKAILSAAWLWSSFCSDLAQTARPVMTWVKCYRSPSFCTRRRCPPTNPMSCCSCAKRPLFQSRPSFSFSTALQSAPSLHPSRTRCGCSSPSQDHCLNIQLIYPLNFKPTTASPSR